MKTILQGLLNEPCVVEISGKKLVNGKIIDIGTDTLVLFNGNDYVYIPIVHIQNIRAVEDSSNEISYPLNSTDLTSILSLEETDWSLRKVLTEAKGIFVEIYVTANQPLHGYITSIMNNYFVFHSPIYKTMYITLNHLKWLIPYSQDQRPYGLDMHNFPVQPTNPKLARTFEVQIEKFLDDVVVLNIGEKNYHIGRIIEISGPIVKIQSARSKPLFINMHHIKTLHQV
ncbi:DUF2642 domain-containing protein [Ornithinibacillus bavariensis]|uniref:DUF2642 domain-containing protein n=1 Tax=Ornithinibacillus bavariensis TaxID=545502 RepID=A0A919XBW6_9BACI|nr:DUF2642 domain-containing protein [Ornithinibacillus bavariensis]GIO28087.1 hypothetical protein J43TS3_26980 [Ornithinibacillus bavariensis]HAM80926.1 DUF2642 domain-containing protein [Ornithinibacillus sp.]